MIFDEMTLCNSIKIIIPDVYTLGVDKLEKLTPEVATCKELNIPYVFIGKHKIASSSDLKKRIN